MFTDAIAVEMNHMYRLRTSGCEYGSTLNPQPLNPKPLNPKPLEFWAKILGLECKPEDVGFLRKGFTAWEGFMVKP